MRLNDLPETGRVVVGHPGNEAEVRRLAEREECDFMLSAWVGPDRVFEINMDRLLDIGKWAP